MSYSPKHLLIIFGIAVVAVIVVKKVSFLNAL